MSYFVIGDEDTVLGFSLVGVPGRIVTTATDTSQALQVAMSTADVSIVIITEQVADRIREEVDKHVGKSTFPLVIEIPDRSGPLPGRKSMKELVKSAIGLSF